VYVARPSATLGPRGSRSLELMLYRSDLRVMDMWMCVDEGSAFDTRFRLYAARARVGGEESRGESVKQEFVNIGESHCIYVKVK
jgi:hypothetical protein